MNIIKFYDPKKNHIHLVKISQHPTATKWLRNLTMRDASDQARLKGWVRLSSVKPPHTTDRLFLSRQNIKAIAENRPEQVSFFS